LVKKIKENFTVQVWKALSIEEIKNSEYLDNIYLDKLLIDSPTPGSGHQFNWQELNDIKFSKEILLAGGVNLLNIDEALTLENINGVDLSSGVEWINEEGNREKSYLKVKEIIRKVREHNER
jgi:phosphoribosylanthranilate isomerase